VTPAASDDGGPGQNAATELLLSIGGVIGHFALGDAPAPFLQQVRDRYGPYTVPPAAWVQRAFSVAVTFTAAVTATDGELRAGEVAARPLRVDESNQAIRVARWDFSAALGPGRVAGSRAVWEGQATCQMNPFALDSLMRVLWAVFLPRSGGALFHACALRIGEGGVIFPGQSGAGKSTLARKLAEPERVLTDELVAVSRAELGRWRVTGTPFWGDFKRGGGSIRSWPLPDERQRRANRGKEHTEHVQFREPEFHGDTAATIVSAVRSEDSADLPEGPEGPKPRRSCDGDQAATGVTVVCCASRLALSGSCDGR